MMVADPFFALFSGANILGLGGDAIAIAIALIAAVAVGWKDIKERNWKNPGIVFISTWGALLGTGIASRTDLFVIMTIVVMLGIVLPKLLKRRS